MLRKSIAILIVLAMAPSLADGEIARVPPSDPKEVDKSPVVFATDRILISGASRFSGSPSAQVARADTLDLQSAHGGGINDPGKPVSTSRTQESPPSAQFVAPALNTTQNCPTRRPKGEIDRNKTPTGEDRVDESDRALINRDGRRILTLSPDRKLSVRLDGVALECVLKELGRQGEIAVNIQKPATNVPVSEEFSNLPLVDGVRRLLEGESYLLEHGQPAGGADGDELGPLVSIIVLGSEAGHGGGGAAPGSRSPLAGLETTPARQRDLEDLAARNMAKLLSGVLNNPLAKTPGLDRIALADLDETEWRTLLEALADGSEASDNLSVQALMDALAGSVHGATSVRDVLDALQGISEIAQELSLAPFYRALEDADAQVDDLARHYLDSLPTQTLLEAVVAAAQDPEPAVRAAALRTLEEMYEFAPVGELAAQAMTDPAPEIRLIAVGLLGYGDHDLAVSQLSEALQDSDPAVREQAAIQLSQLMNEFEQQHASK